METPAHCCFSLPLLLNILLLTSTFDKTFSSSIATDQNALLAFKNAVIPVDPNNNDILARNWSSNGSTTTTSVCYWVGVSCGVKHKRVTSLTVSGFGLKGTLPPHLGNLTFLRYLDMSSNNFSGLIPPEMSRLHRLREINLETNSLTGEIPSWFGDLPHLEILSLGNNSFSGKIPPSLFNNNSCKLQIIFVRFNNLSGSIPDEIGNCSSLQIVQLESNKLTGSIPYGIFGLPSITQVWMSNNEISGSLPIDMCNHGLSNLTTLGLSYNQLEGQIPRNIWKCTQLERLSLSYNRFKGKIPSEIGSLSMLKALHIGFNDFQGGIPVELGRLLRLEILTIANASLTGPIPSQLGNCNSLKILDIGRNHLTGGILQPELGSLYSQLEVLSIPNASLTGNYYSIPNVSLYVCDIVSKNVTHFPNKLRLKNITGPIPQQLWNSTSLRELYISNNYLTGSLPLKCSLFNIEILYLDYNQLSGEIPSSITNASKLTELQLDVNSFSGSIPNFGNLRLLQRLTAFGNKLSGAEYPSQELEFFHSLTSCQSLELVDFTNNPLNGILPTSIGNLSKSLEGLYATDCNIKGVIPASIGYLTGLQSLDLGGNNLSGFIPPTIGKKLNQLRSSHLNDNRLEGYVPSNLCRLNKIYELYLDDNLLTGPIPECLGNIDSLRGIVLGSNKLNSTIPSNLWNLKDLLFLDLSSNYLSGQLSSQIARLKTINSLDLSHNQFSGDIPISIEGCESLEYLSLSNNKFEGSIPASFEKMRGLSGLDLSYNNLSGFIPKSLETLIFLQSFNVSNNKLHGEIPGGGPFVNFTAQSFANNSGLCGAIKFQVPPCPVQLDNKTSRLKKVGKLMKYIVPPFVLVISLATIIILVLVTRQRRKLKRRGQAPANDVSRTWRRVSYIELSRGTNAFSEINLLGKGSFGSVFKATLSDGFIVAVKVFNSQSKRSVESFDTECEILGTIRHRNLVKIIGCCSNTEFKSLVLEHMSNGSLEKWLHSENCRLNLIQRLQIAIDVALALEYLHHGHTCHIVHCDIKPSNVLLDEDMVAHLADFGISKLLDDGETMVYTKTLATIGYAAPEYGSEGRVSTNGDVYSYGILLLEMFTGKKPTDDIFSDEMSLKEWVCQALQENAASEVAAPDLLVRGDDQVLSGKEEECVSSIFNLAMKCLDVSPDERTNMIETVNALQRIKAKVATLKTRLRHHA